MAGPHLKTAGASYPRIDTDQVQGIVLRGYRDLPESLFVLLEVIDRTRAARWLGRLAGKLTTAAVAPRETAVNIALTRAGLDKLGLDVDTLAMFSREFLEGMVADETRGDWYRSRMLGDIGESAPEHWLWGSPKEKHRIHLVLLLYASGPGKLRRLYKAQAKRFGGALVELGRPLRGHLFADRREHFGFRDGISQPKLRNGNAGEGERANALLPDHEANSVNAGEFLLGYLDEFGRYPPSPLVKAERDPSELLPPAERKWRDLGRNGSYLVFRQLEQDVHGFWSYVCKEAGAGPDARRLASKMVGRWPGGAPLTSYPHREPARPEGRSDRELGYNDFGFALNDANGYRCPIGSHIRRSNPRDWPGEEKSLLRWFGRPVDSPNRIANRHRILRRGRVYGKRLDVDALIDELTQSGPRGGEPEPVAASAGEERGLLFLCLAGSIRRQYEFLQQTWCNDPNFAGLRDETDPLVGLGEGGFTIQGPVPRHIDGLPRFVRVVGGAYFFMPSIQAVRYLASAGRSSDGGR